MIWKVYRIFILHLICDVTFFFECEDLPIICWRISSVTFRDLRFPRLKSTEMGPKSEEFKCLSFLIFNPILRPFFFVFFCFFCKMAQIPNLHIRKVFFHLILMQLFNLKSLWQGLQVVFNWCPLSVVVFRDNLAMNLVKEEALINLLWSFHAARGVAFIYSIYM